MLPTPTNLATFCEYDRNDMSDWLSIAIETYFVRNGGPLAFAPFETQVLTSGSVAEALWKGLQLVPLAVRQRFRRALNTLPSRLAPDPGPWNFLVEMVFRIDAADAVDAIERRLTPYFLSELLKGDEGIIDDIVRYIQNVSPSHEGTHRPLARLLSRLAVSGFIANSQARNILLRLCEIDPDHWTAHVSLLRDLLHRQFSRILVEKGYNRMMTVQDELSKDIFNVIGPERYFKDFSSLRYVTDASGSLPTDNWLWRSLLERQQIVVPTFGGGISWNQAPSDGRTVADRRIERQPSKEPIDLGRRSSGRLGTASMAGEPDILLSSTEEVDWALGRNSLKTGSNDAGQSASAETERVHA